MSSPHLHEVVITASVVKDGRYLIVRRSPQKKRFPGMWTVPGGKLETSDYTQHPKDTEADWYNVLERTLRREVLEETGLEIQKGRCTRVGDSGRGQGVRPHRRNTGRTGHG